MYDNPEDAMQVIWNALHSYAETCLGNQIGQDEDSMEYADEWAEVCEAMSHIQNHLSAVPTEGIGKTIRETIAVYRENKAEGFFLGPPDDTHELYLLLLDKDLDEDDKDEVREMIDLNEAYDFLTKSDLEIVKE